MSLPSVAIVGRPNVGKSSLLNRLARQRISIVSPVPGVTRDRVGAVIEIDPPSETPRETPPAFVEVIDTGGYGAYTAEGSRYDDVGEDLATLAPQIEAQISAALSEAAVVLFVVDVQSGLTALDHGVADLLRRRGAAKRVVAVANKTDGEKWLAAAQEASALGFGAPMAVSATTGFGMRALLSDLWRRAGAAEADRPPESAPAPPAEMRIAIIARRNAGKSTLVNALAGEPRVIVSEIAGTTRDAVDVRFEIDGRHMIAIDTAGVRKRKSVADPVEFYAYERMLGAVDRADVAVLMLDATLPVSTVEKKLGKELQERYKPVVIAVNKWDLVQDKLQPEDYQKYLTEQLRGLDYAPIVFISAKDGEGVRDLVAMAFNLYEQASHHETTGRLNRIVAAIVQRRGPSSRLGTQAKVYYAAQIAVRPPTIALVVNDPKLFRGGYERYLVNRLHEELGCSEVPIKVLFRKHRRIELSPQSSRRR